MTIGNDYFKNYAGRGKPYTEIYEDHTSVHDCIAHFQADDAPKIRSICVLGSATGLVLNDLKEGFGVKPYGCEINEWAFEQTPKEFRPRVKCEDMRTYVEHWRKKNKTFDLGFSNSLVYLDKEEVPGFLRKLAHLFKYLHFDSSFTGYACPDPYRKTLKSYKWWNEQLERAGFEEMRTLFDSRSFLWKSRKLL